MNMMKKASLVGALAAATLFASDSAPQRIDQKNREFSVTTITLKPGDKLEFCNSDDVTHNVFSKSKVNAFNLKTQLPGSSSVVEFKEEGVTEIRCAIHPSMKLIVTVKQ